MALVVKDRVKEITTTTGTSNLTLGGASYGFQSFSIIGNGNQTYYGIYDPSTGDWEVGVGTYSTTGPTLSRDTVLESSNSGSKVVFGAGSKDVFCTYPAERSVYLDTAGSAVTLLDIGTLGVSTANITTANITAGTISTTPTSSNDLVNKTYVDGIAAQGITYHEPVKYEVPNTTGNLNATYSNGTAGVGATLTNAGTKAAFAPDGPTASVGDRVLIYNQTSAFQNGVYEVSVVGTPDPGGTNWVLTRTADADSYGLKDPNALGQGDAFFVTSGNTGAGETYVCNTAGTITFGTTAITFAQISSAQIYSAGTGLTLSNLVFSITPVGTASTYGSASSVPVFTTNASGQVTSVTNTGIAISAAAVSGLAPSATTDTTNASNITSGTLPSARLAGSYTGITGVGTLTAGTWTATAIGAAYGGTGLTTYAQGDLLYATSSSTLGRLADVVTGNALISGGVGADPSWGKIGLQTHVSGTLQVTNGGTGATDATGARSNLGLVIGTNIPSVTGSGASGTWGINITGNAATATTATTSTTATSVSNSVTFNNSGAGAASGNGFNGSSALTVSYNTIGAPSTTGTNASGTWGISISGNAATATTATNAPNYLPLAGGTMTGAVNFLGTVYNTIGGSRFFAGSGGINYLYTNTSGMSWRNQADSATVASLSNAGAFNTAGAVTITAAIGDATPSLILAPNSSSGTFQWASRAISSGLGAGQTMIHLLGNAASSGNSGYIGFNYTGAASSSNYASIGLYGNDNILRVYNGTYTQSLGSLRAPIFYDSDDTAYYGDFASSTTSVRAAGALYQGSLLSRPYAVWGGNGTTTGAVVIKLPGNTGNYGMVHAVVDIYEYNGNNVATVIIGGHNWNGAWYNYGANVIGYTDKQVRLSVVGGQFAIVIGTDGSSWSYGQVVLRKIQNGSYYAGIMDLGGTYSIYQTTSVGASWDSGNINSFRSTSITATSAMYSPIFYDSNNTGYYGDFASTSRMNEVQSDRTYGFTDIRSPIFYDYNNTGYYVDPNGSSVLLSGSALGTWYFYSNLGGYSGSLTNPALQAYSTGNNSAFFSFHKSGHYALNMGLDADNVLRIGGWSASANLFQMDMSGNLTMAGNVTAYSDENLKKDWAELPDDFVERLAGVKSGTYTRIDFDQRQAGTSAQDWQELLPEVVSEDASGVLSLAYGNAALVACVELAKSVVALRAELNALRAQ